MVKKKTPKNLYEKSRTSQLIAVQQSKLKVKNNPLETGNKIFLFTHISPSSRLAQFTTGSKTQTSSFLLERKKEWNVCPTFWLWDIQPEWLTSVLSDLNCWLGTCIPCTAREHREQKRAQRLVGSTRVSCCCCYWCSLTQSYLTLCGPMDCSTPGFPVNHHLSEFTQTHVHWVSNVIQLPHHLSSTSAFNIPQHQGLFQWVGCLHQVARVLEL